jgi:hypothetical protein
MTLTCSPGHCNGPCYSGSWCFQFYGCTSAGWMCMPGSCRTYTKDCCP